MLTYIKNSLNEIFVAPSDGRFSPLDGLRALVIICVVIFHGFFFTRDVFINQNNYVDFVKSIPWWLWWVFQCHISIEILFIVSSFLISTALFTEYKNNLKIDYKWFYIKRFLRVYPLYIFVLLIVLPLTPDRAKYFWFNLLAVHNLFYVERALVPWTWAVAVELQFYLIAPFLIILLYKSKKPFAWIIFFIFCSLLWRFFSVISEPGLYTSTVLEIYIKGSKDVMLHYWRFIHAPIQSHLPAFMCGTFAGYLWVFKKNEIEKYFSDKTKIWMISIITIVFIIIYNAVSPEWVPDLDLNNKFIRIFYIFSFSFNYFIFSVLMSLIVLMTCINSSKNCFFTKILSIKFLYPVAKTSYAIFLFHIFFFTLSYYILYGKEKVNYIHWSATLIVTLLTFVLTFFFSILCYILIEKPFLSGKIKDYLYKKLSYGR